MYKPFNKLVKTKLKAKNSKLKTSGTNILELKQSGLY
jgi:hypothetical protein